MSKEKDRWEDRHDRASSDSQIQWTAIFSQLSISRRKIQCFLVRIDHEGSLGSATIKRKIIREWSALMLLKVSIACADLDVTVRWR